jgi:PadR family transcriptional regulator PadR
MTCHSHTKGLCTIKQYVYAYMYDLTGFQRDLLYVIAGHDEPHGLALKDELEDYYEKEIHHGRLYPNLDTLVEKGLIEKGTKDRRTNSYGLSRRGEREIESRQEWEEQYITPPVTPSD